MVVCGNDGAVYQTDPSGAVKKCIMNHDNQQLLIIGGSETRQAQVKSEIYKRVLDKNKTDLSETLQRLARILLQDNDKQSDDDNAKKQQKWLEVAVLSPTHGVHRLTDPQVQALIESVDNVDKKS